MRVLCVGYFGRGNFGDDLYLTLVASHLLPAGHQVGVLTRGPHAIPDADKVLRFQAEALVGIPRAIAWADYILFPGGSVLQNATSNRSLSYYLGVCALASIFRKPIVFLSQGYGPVRGSLHRRLTLECIRGARVFVARDEETARFLRAEGIVNVVVAADWTWRIPISRPEPNNAREVIVVPAPRELPPESLLGKDCVLVAAEKDSVPLIYAFARRHGMRWLPATDLFEWHSAISNACLVVSAKYHATIFSLLAGLPVIAIGTDPKIRSLALRFSLSWYSGYGTVPAAFTELVPHPPAFDRLKAVQSQAQRNEEILRDVLAGG